MHRRAWIASGVVVGALVGGLAAYYLPLLWWYFANGLSDTSGGPTGVQSIPVLAPFGALMGAGFGGLTMANRTESLSRAREREDPGGALQRGSGDGAPTDPGQTPEGRPSSEPPRDRLPRIIVPAMFVTLALAGAAAVYGVAKPSSHGAADSTSAIVSTPEANVRQERPPAPRYAGLTRDRAAELAGADFATLLGIGSGSEGGVVATTGRKLSRTRCYHSRHWRPYWRVSFEGGSPIFESRPRALLFCNRDPHVIEVSEPIQH